MGTLRSFDREPVGHSYRGITLGEPVEIDGDLTTLEWDHGSFPTGTVAVVDGELVVTPDESPLITTQTAPVEEPVEEILTEAAPEEAPVDEEPVVEEEPPAPKPVAKRTRKKAGS